MNAKKIEKFSNGIENKYVILLNVYENVELLYYGVNEFYDYDGSFNHCRINIEENISILSKLFLNFFLK